MEKILFKPSGKDLKKIDIRTSSLYVGTVVSTYDTRITGYLLEPVKVIVTGTKGSAEEIHYKPLALSWVSNKSNLNRLLRALRNDYFHLPTRREYEPGKSGTYYRAMPFFKGEPDLKSGGLHVETTEIANSPWSHTVTFRKDLLETSIDKNGVVKGYILGEDLEDIKLGLPRFFRDASFPYLAEWLPLLEKEVFSRKEWSTRLVGFNMDGYALHIPQADILGLLQTKAQTGEFSPITEETTA